MRPDGSAQGTKDGERGEYDGELALGIELRPEGFPRGPKHGDAGA